MAVKKWLMTSGIWAIAGKLLWKDGHLTQDHLGSQADLVVVQKWKGEDRMLEISHSGLNFFNHFKGDLSPLIWYE